MEFDIQADGVRVEVLVVDLGRNGAPPARAPTTIAIGVDRGGVLPAVDAANYDLLLTTAAAPARSSWLAVRAAELDAMLSQLAQQVEATGMAGAVLAQVLRLGTGLAVPEALLLESFAYAMLLGGDAFRDWLRRRSPQSLPEAGTRVRCMREADLLTIILANAARRNTLDARMRDELVESLAAATDDPTAPLVQLRAEGPDFSAGGDFAEFGLATDMPMAHAVRCLRSPVRLIHAIAARTTAFVQGACVGAGIEIAAAAGRVVARPDARFWLPELAMGLIPGAGGTVTVARRIGRQRLLQWALGGQRIDAGTALTWGLIDEVRGPS
jgi:hypothetical protein